MKYCIIGCGAMGSAIAKALASSHHDMKHELALYDADEDKALSLSAHISAQGFTSIAHAVKDANVVILAVKPHIVPAVVSEISPLLAAHTLVISIAAGTTIGTLEALCAANQPVVRVMPNVGLQVATGASAFSLGQACNKDHAEIVSHIFGGSNVCVQVEERLMNAVTGLSGSGPAYALLVIEALADGGVQAGLPKHVALELAAQTLAGAAALVLDTKQHPAVLKDMVTTPAGTTIAGLSELERSGVRHAFMNAVMAAKKRADELS
ncbi:MAG: pyrroline-5-carboxylate reductase [Armatimonadota bacterium]